jgi:hypothetical protein
MKPNGQLLSLDFLLAIGLVILALGVSLKFSHQAVFEWQEQQERNELEKRGENAVLLLMSNPENTCEIKDTGGNGLGEHVNNCVNSATPSPITKETVGLPEEWDYSILNETTGGTWIAGNPSIPSGTPNVFSADVKAILSDSDGMITKAGLYSCLKKSGCTLEEKTIRVMIWKD